MPDTPRPYDFTDPQADRRTGGSPAMPDTQTTERRAVEKWLAQWGIHNDAEIGGLLDALERAHLDALTAAVEAMPPWLRTDDEAGKAAGETGAIDVVERVAVLAILRGEQWTDPKG
jgi:hypothetical protein